GGINKDNAGEVMAAGADSVAVISAILQAVVFYQGDTVLGGGIIEDTDTIFC
ncbi:unnamed protein product, partial [marine sediment metagenome]